MQGASQEPGRGSASALIGFLVMSFAVVGLTGLLAAHVVALPLERALARETVLDEAVLAARRGDAAGLEALRVRLGDSAPAVLPARGAAPPADFEARVAAERIAMRARRLAEADATATRLRVMLVVVTLLAAAFGVGMMLAGRRVARGPGMV